MKRFVRSLALLLIAALLITSLAACQTRPVSAGTQAPDTSVSPNGQTSTPPASEGSGQTQEPGTPVTPPSQGGNDEPAQGGDTEPAQGGDTEPAGQGGEAGTPSQLAAGVSFSNPASYADVFKALNANYRGGFSGGSATSGIATDGGLMEEAEVPTASDASANGMSGGAAAPTGASAGAEAPTEQGGIKGSDDGDFSGTNVQVDGVDEGDIFKTNGRNGFMLRNGRELLVFSLAGADSDVLAQISVGWYNFRNDKGTDDNGYTWYSYREDYRTVSQMMLDGDRLVLLGSFYRYSYDYGYDAEGNYKGENGENVNRSFVEIYDVSDPASPALLQSVELDGSFTDSRMTGGILYLVTTWYCWGADEDDPTTYVPGLRANGEEIAIPLDRLYIPEAAQSYAWCMAVSIDPHTGEVVSDSAILGGWGTIYMNADNLYLAISTWRDESPEPYTEDQYLVEEHRAGSYTDILRFAIQDGELNFVGIGTVPGSLLNQFSMDEKDGFLRVVTTADGYSYKLYKDEKHGFMNYVYDNDSRRSNGLYVLDEAMSLVSALDGLAENESVYSVRFMGELCYFVTFRQTDPLFAVDLADPYAPVLLSELKITGFSNYLHPWDDGLLFGIGMEADLNGRTEGMKLAMFDTSDPTDLKVVDSVKLDNWYSSALYDHHAILIDRQKNLIAFRSESGYEIFGYGENGFEKRAHVELADYGYWNEARACWSGSYLYLFGYADCHVLDLETLEEITAFKSPEELQTDDWYVYYDDVMYD